MFKAVGARGELRHGHIKAATFSHWALEDGRVEARADSIDSFWLTAPGSLTLRLYVGLKLWVWTDVAVLDSGTPFVMKVTGQPEIR